jgi:hypothetical protein
MLRSARLCGQDTLLRRAGSWLDAHGNRDSETGSQVASGLDVVSSLTPSPAEHALYVDTRMIGDVDTSRSGRERAIFDAFEKRAAELVCEFRQGNDREAVVGLGAIVTPLQLDVIETAVRGARRHYLHGAGADLRWCQGVGLRTDEWT